MAAIQGSKVHVYSRMLDCNTRFYFGERFNTAKEQLRYESGRRYRGRQWPPQLFVGVNFCSLFWFIALNFLPSGDLARPRLIHFSDQRMI